MPYLTAEQPVQSYPENYWQITWSFVLLDANYKYPELVERDNQGIHHCGFGQAKY